MRFQTVAAKPDIIFTDRGCGFYEPASGRIKADYKAALKENQFKAFMRDNAAEQPGSLQDVLLHATAVSWLCHRLSIITPTNCWHETCDEHGRCLRRCCNEANTTYDVEVLCQGYPQAYEFVAAEAGRPFEEIAFLSAPVWCR